jgi:thioredoxin 1
MTQHVSDADFKKIVLESKIPVFVDFFAEWCGPCKMMAPFVDEFAESYEGKVLIVKVDVDQAMDTAQEYGIMSIPTFISFKDGKVVDSATGGMPKEALQEKLDALLN